VHTLRQIAIKILPNRFVEWYRRRRARNKYLTALAYEIYDRGIRLELDDLEGRIAARRDGFYDRLAKDVLERTELVLQELDRKIEGLIARHGAELRHLQAEVTDIRAALAALGPAQAPTPPTLTVVEDPQHAPERSALADTPTEPQPAPVDH
jgi:hypothetical protein